jgi:gamma-glutamyltranspeptidase/glutathione hydrolase
MTNAMAFASRRSPVLGTRGMVATSQPLAVAAGLEILAAGGNAADAAVATAAALNVCEPTSTGIGGDAFALWFDGRDGRVQALNGSGRAPAGLTIERLRKEGIIPAGGAEGAGSAEGAAVAIPRYHAHAVTVPGACSAWCELLDRQGRLGLAQVLAPAIRLAEEGFPVAPITAHFWARGAARQLAHAPGGRELTLDGRAPAAGEIFRNPGLARTFRALAEGGPRAFYEGRIAEAIAEVIGRAGGCMRAEDLAAQRAEWVQPISSEYRGYRIWECPPNGQGLAALLGLNLLEGFDPAEMPAGSAQRLHLQIEAMRLAFADTRWFAADPATNPAPLEALLSRAYADERRARIDPRLATLDQIHGAPSAASDTVYLSVVDGEGNACSFINSNYMGFGTGIVPAGWGFTLQNRGHGFDLDPDHPNALAPGKRPYHTIIPAMITRPGEADSAATIAKDSGSTRATETLFACYGVMGGYMQPQGHLQVAVGLIDDGLDPQAALDRPRFCIADGRAGGSVSLEEGIPVAVMADLAARGHPVVPVAGHGRAVFGRGQAILRQPSGTLWGGSDPRADGCAMAL